jgi:transposase
LEIVSNACARAGVLVRYLPPYSPDFNPIEYSFHDLKAWVQRNWIYTKKYPDFGQFLQEAICQTSGPANAIAYFRDCRVELEGG